jgi:hypothetical protein
MRRAVEGVSLLQKQVSNRAWGVGCHRHDLCCQIKKPLPDDKIHYLRRTFEENHYESIATARDGGLIVALEARRWRLAGLSAAIPRDQDLETVRTLKAVQETHTLRHPACSGTPFRVHDEERRTFWGIVALRLNPRLESGTPSTFSLCAASSGSSPSRAGLTRCKLYAGSSRPPLPLKDAQSGRKPHKRVSPRGYPLRVPCLRARIHFGREPGSNVPKAE